MNTPPEFESDSKKIHCIKVWGDFACFTRPEMKVERFSYPIITPSAARGIFDAIFWKKEYNFFWQIEKIELLSMPKYIALRRNEVKDKIPVNTVYKWMKSSEPVTPIFADAVKSESGTDLKGRTQRQTMALSNVCYQLHAYIRCRDSTSYIKALNAQFERRATTGKCFYQPFFGCREFPAYFELANSDSLEQPVQIDLDLGYMLYDVFDLNNDSNNNSEKPSISVFHAQIKNGVLEIPGYNSNQAYKA